jgi:hypothetical protein
MVFSHLINIVIVDPTQIDLELQAVFSRGVATTIMAQTKDGLYHDQYSIDMFLSLVVDIFECLHQ